MHIMGIPLWRKLEGKGASAGLTHNLVCNLPLDFGKAVFPTLSLNPISLLYNVWTIIFLKFLLAVKL